MEFMLISSPLLASLVPPFLSLDVPVNNQPGQLPTSWPPYPISSPGYLPDNLLSFTVYHLDHYGLGILMDGKLEIGIDTHQGFVGPFNSLNQLQLAYGCGLISVGIYCPEILGYIPLGSTPYL